MTKFIVTIYVISVTTQRKITVLSNIVVTTESLQLLGNRWRGKHYIDID